MCYPKRGTGWARWMLNGQSKASPRSGRGRGRQIKSFGLDASSNGFCVQGASYARESLRLYDGDGRTQPWSRYTSAEDAGLGDKARGLLGRRPVGGMRDAGCNSG